MSSFLRAVAIVFASFWVRPRRCSRTVASLSLCVESLEERRLLAGVHHHALDLLVPPANDILLTHREPERFQRLHIASGVGDPRADYTEMRTGDVLHSGSPILGRADDIQRAEALRRRLRLADSLRDEATGLSRGETNDKSIAHERNSATEVSEGFATSTLTRLTEGNEGHSQMPTPVVPSGHTTTMEERSLDSAADNGDALQGQHPDGGQHSDPTSLNQPAHGTAVVVGRSGSLRERDTPAEQAADTHLSANAENGAARASADGHRGLLPTPTSAQGLLSDTAESGIEAGAAEMTANASLHLLLMADGRLGPTGQMGEAIGSGIAQSSAPISKTSSRPWLRDFGQVLAQALYLGTLRPGAGSASGDTVTVAAEALSDPRLVVADLIQRSVEALGRLVQGFYLVYLGRVATAGEENGWVGMLLNGQTQEQVLSAFLGTAEFASRASALELSGTTDERFIRALHTVLLHRPATENEVSGWLAALPVLGRQGITAQFLASTEYRTAQVASFYEEIAQRPGSASEVASWANSPFDVLTIRKFFEMRTDLMGR